MKSILAAALVLAIPACADRGGSASAAADSAAVMSAVHDYRYAWMRGVAPEFSPAVEGRRPPVKAAILDPNAQPFHADLSLARRCVWPPRRMPP